MIFISWITGHNIQELQVLVFFASYIASILNMEYIEIWTKNNWWTSMKLPGCLTYICLLHSKFWHKILGTDKRYYLNILKKLLSVRTTYISIIVHLWNPACCIQWTVMVVCKKAVSQCHCVWQWSNNSCIKISQSYQSHWTELCINIKDFLLIAHKCWGLETSQKLVRMTKILTSWHSQSNKLG